MTHEAYLELIDQVNAAGPYHADWDNLAAHPIPAWYRQKRLGIFLHWGVFSVPAYHDWYARNMYIQGSEEYEHHLKHWGPHKDFGWKDFVPLWTMQDFDPDAWVALFKEAGADYIVPVAEHHDGFQNYKSDLSHWNAFEMGPHRDVLGDLLEASERGGLTIGTSSHRIEHWFFLSHGREFDSDIQGDYQRGDLYWPSMPEGNHHDLFSEPTPTQEYLEDWLCRCCELVDRYHPRILYFDWWIQHSAAREYLKKFTAYYFNRMEPYGGCVINTKHDAMPFGIAVPDIERGAFAEPKAFLWQSDTSVMRGSWCYSSLVERSQPKPANELIWTLCDVVSKNGRLLLNIGPKPDGTISQQDSDLLLALGRWMKINGEAIRDTNVWRISQEGPTKSVEGQFTDGADASYTAQDFRFTCRGSSIYCICMGQPEDAIHIQSLRIADASHLPLFNGIIDKVQILGYDTPLTWMQDTEGLHIPLQGISSQQPLVVKVTVR